MIRVKEETIHSIFSLTESLLEKYPLRTPGTIGGISAADELSENMKKFCDKTEKETFFMHPGALFSTGKVLGIAYAICLLLLIPGGVFNYIAFGICMLAFVYAVIHYFLYVKLFDRFFKKGLHRCSKKNIFTIR